MNNSLLLSLAAVGALSSSCASTYRLSETPNLVDVVNGRTKGQEVIVGLDSIDIYRDHYQRALNLRIGSDSVYWIDPETLQSVGVPRARLAEVTVVDGGAGAGYGAAIGFGFGAIAGLGTALSSHDKSGWTGPRAGVVIGIGVGLPSAAVGALLGGIIGHEDRYEMLLPPVGLRDGAAGSAP